MRKKICWYNRTRTSGSLGRRPTIRNSRHQQEIQKNCNKFDPLKRLNPFIQWSTYSFLILLLSPWLYEWQGFFFFLLLLLVLFPTWSECGCRVLHEVMLVRPLRDVLLGLERLGGAGTAGGKVGGGSFDVKYALERVSERLLLTSLMSWGNSSCPSCEWSPAWKDG